MPPVSPALQGGVFTSEPPGGPIDQVMIAKMTPCIPQEEGVCHIRSGWVQAPLELTRERETVAKAFIVISMGVWTLIKKKKKKERIMCFIGKMILFGKSRKLQFGMSKLW